MDQASRIAHLRDISAPIRFLSCEPLLGSLAGIGLKDIRWVIVGGESGPGARTMQPAWARELRDKCQKWEIPFFMKQITNNKGVKIPVERWPSDLRIRKYPN